ncbi:hypothetical protein ACF0H5_012922 [Mactra antiquata]
MAESGGMMRDEGISDVLSKNGSDGSRKPEPSVDIEVIEYHDGVNNKSEHSDGHNKDKSNDAHPHPERSQSPGKELDLADPDSVIHMLETCDLTEEDTEDLLQEAYNMNRKLKEMLRRKEMEGDPSKSKTKSPNKSKGGASTNGKAPGSEGSSRQGSSFGIRKVLPPIHQAGGKETSVYAIQMKRSKTSIQQPKSHYGDAVPRSKSSKDEVRKDAPSPVRRRKTEIKPEWNNRFNYS